MSAVATSVELRSVILVESSSRALTGSLKVKVIVSAIRSRSKLTRAAPTVSPLSTPTAMANSDSGMVTLGLPNASAKTLPIRVRQLKARVQRFRRRLMACMSAAANVILIVSPRALEVEPLVRAYWVWSFLTTTASGLA